MEGNRAIPVHHIAAQNWY